MKPLFTLWLDPQQPDNKIEIYADGSTKGLEGAIANHSRPLIESYEAALNKLDKLGALKNDFFVPWDLIRKSSPKLDS